MASLEVSTRLQIRTKDLIFVAAWEDDKAPRSCAALRRLLPLSDQMKQARWSGEAAYVEIDHLDLDIDFENHTVYPSKGELLVYPGFISGKEILIPYGAAAFASRRGVLAGNHFATIVSGQEQLEELGRRVALEGAQELELREVPLE